MTNDNMNFSDRRLLDFVIWKPTHKYPETSAISFRFPWLNMDSPYVRTMWMPCWKLFFAPRITVLLNFWGLGFTHCGGGGRCSTSWSFVSVSLPVTMKKSTTELLMDKVLHQLIQSIFNYFCKGFSDPKGCGDESSFDCFVGQQFK